MFLGVSDAVPLKGGGGRRVCVSKNFGTSFMRAHSMRNNNVILHGESTKVKVVAPPQGSVSKALRYSTHCQTITQFYLHTLHFSRKRNEPYLSLPFQPQLVLIH